MADEETGTVTSTTESLSHTTDANSADVSSFSLENVSDTESEQEECQDQCGQRQRQDPLVLLEELISTPGNEFEATLRFAIYVGQAAHRYGSAGSKVESFLQTLLEKRYGFHLGLFRSSQSELLCSIEDIPRTFMVRIENGLNLNKLGQLAELVDKVMDQEISQAEALEQLKVIDKSSDPWGFWVILLCFGVTSASLTMVLGGSWWDVLIAFWLGILCYSIMEGLPRIRPKFERWVPLVTSFACSAVSNLCKLYWEDINVTLVTLCSIIVLVPGYSVSMGLAELISNRIVSGFALLVGGMVTLVWLVVGAALGDELVAAMISATEDASEEGLNSSIVESNSIPGIWQALFIPILLVCLTFIFQVGLRDLGWSLMHLTLTYVVFYATGEWSNGNLGVFVSTAVSTVAANAWAIRFNRPNSILLVPSLVLQVSGSIGFQGLINIVDGNRSLGGEQFLQMIIIAMLIAAGLLAGNTFLEPETTL